MASLRSTFIALGAIAALRGADAATSMPGPTSSITTFPIGAADKYHLECSVMVAAEDTAELASGSGCRLVMGPIPAPPPFAPAPPPPPPPPALVDGYLVRLDASTAESQSASTLLNLGSSSQTVEWVTGSSGANSFQAGVQSSQEAGFNNKYVWDMASRAMKVDGLTLNRAGGTFFVVYQHTTATTFGTMVAHGHRDQDISIECGSSYICVSHFHDNSAFLQVPDARPPVVWAARFEFYHPEEDAEGLRRRVVSLKNDNGVKQRDFLDDDMTLSQDKKDNFGKWELNTGGSNWKSATFDPVETGMTGYELSDSAIRRLWIGTSNGNGWETLGGKMAEVVYYNTVLTDEEMTQNEVYLYDKWLK